MKINYLALLATPVLLLTVPLAANAAVGDGAMIRGAPISSTFTAPVPNALPKEAAKLAVVVVNRRGRVLYRGPGWGVRPYYRNYRPSASYYAAPVRRTWVY